MILECCRVTLRLLQNGLHDWVAHNLLRRKLSERIIREEGVVGGTHSDFWIAQSSLHDIVIRLSLSLSELRLLTFQDLVMDLLLMCIGFVMFIGFLQDLDGLDVFPHRVQDM